MSRFNRNEGRLSATLSLEYEVGDDSFEVVVDLTANRTRFVPARTWGDPDSCYPEEGGDVDDVEATCESHAFELSDALMDEALDILNDVEVDGPDPDSYYDSRYDY